ncbi:hypothetical protein LXA19_17455 [Erwinia amylovora]|uniref:hypothetical protein n=1 Tax=Erwinia amylovora TaxID=552 RepID=UPI0020BF1426|nr:hypothetical protein [Erwinia amylovora]MCK8373811.1 hypothetical protein [Erwinia amylovora]
MSKRLKNDDFKGSNVTPIRKDMLKAANDSTVSERNAKLRWLAGAVGWVSVGIVRGVIFCLLLWLRIPLKMLLGCISIMAFIGVLISWGVFSDLSMVPGFIGIGLSCTALAWCYDLVLSWLEPSK